MNKYRAKKFERDGIIFDSIREANRYLELSLQVRAGIISDLERQVPYVVLMNDTKGKPTPICKYIADFRYKSLDGKVMVEDAKGFKTPLYRLKKKLIETQYGIQIYEV